MFIHLAVHHPRPGHEADLLSSMARVADAAKDAPGLIRMDAWRDQLSGRLVGLALWADQESFAHSADRIFETVANDPFHEWCERSPEVFHLIEP